MPVAFRIRQQSRTRAWTVRIVVNRQYVCLKACFTKAPASEASQQHPFPYFEVLQHTSVGITNKSPGRSGCGQGSIKFAQPLAFAGNKG